MDKPKIAFIGLGTMGLGMSNRLIDAGYPLAVWNRSPEKAAGLAAKGARVAANPRDAAKDAEIIIAMVADDPASRSTWLGESGALAGAKNGAIGIDCSTLTIEWVRELAAEASKRGVHFLDVPVTGTKPHAEKGELTLLVGGDAADLEKVRPALAVMSKEIVHLGPIGSGAAIKLVNNFLCGVHAAALGEAISMINKCGLNPEAAVAVLLNGAPGSPLSKTVNTRQTTQDPTVYFQLALMQKDLTYAVQEAKARGIDLSTAKAALKRFQAASAAGRGAKDFSAILQPLPG
jgi:3-hydroxyisobutyrate dehydrogenase